MPSDLAVQASAAECRRAAPTGSDTYIMPVAELGNAARRYPARRQTCVRQNTAMQPCTLSVPSACRLRIDL